MGCLLIAWLVLDGWAARDRVNSVIDALAPRYLFHLHYFPRNTLVASDIHFSAGG